MNVYVIQKITMIPVFVLGAISFTIEPLSAEEHLCDVASTGIELAWPVECINGDQCVIQQYVDQEPGPDYADFMGNKLSYDGHAGTDIRALDLEGMINGISVLAAANGTVRAVRDGIEDAYLTPERRAALSGKGCGNGVVIEHDNGWRTQYCHLKKGSVSVQPGDPVETGMRLGDIGLSGFTEFPHLEFIVRHDDTVVDPFVPWQGAACMEAARTLWVETPDYIPGGLLTVGFSDAVPDYADVKAGSAHSETLSTPAGALVLWAYLFGTRAGDTLDMRIFGPNDEPVFQRRIDIDRSQAQAFRAAGRRLRGRVMPVGIYRGEIDLWRNGEKIDGLQTTTRLISE